MGFRAFIFKNLMISPTRANLTELAAVFLKLGSMLWLPIFDPQILAIVPMMVDRPSSLVVLGIFLKIGATIYGGGYVLLAFLQPELVDRTH